MSSVQPKRSRRPRGTGMVYAKDNTWMGKWYVRGKPVKRSLGPIRRPGTREGLTKCSRHPAVSRQGGVSSGGVVLLSLTGSR
jgi:hypothetical protein